MLTWKKILNQDRKCMYNVTLRDVRKTIVTVREKKMLHVMNVYL